MWSTSRREASELKSKANGPVLDGWEMKVQRSRLRVVLSATAVLVGACGRIGYDLEGLESGSGTSAGGAVAVGTGSGATLGTFDATGIGGVAVGSAGASITGMGGSLA